MDRIALKRVLLDHCIQNGIPDGAFYVRSSVYDDTPELNKLEDCPYEAVIDIKDCRLKMYGKCYAEGGFCGEYKKKKETKKKVVVQKGGKDSYDSGQKKNWRRWVWNQIDPKLDGIVLYLCGPYDYDRELALKKCFKNHNLIAIDLNKKNIDGVRKGGGLGVCGEVGEILRNFDGLKISGIIVDYCCNFSKCIKKMVLGLIQCGCIDKDCSVIINMLRGREGKENFAMLNNMQLLCRKYIVETVGLSNVLTEKQKKINLKSRALAFYNYYLIELINNLEKHNQYKSVSNIYNYLFEQNNLYNDIEFFEYKSDCGQTFDSISFKPRFGKLELKASGKHKNKKIRAQISNVKAMRTMRMNGTIK